MSSVSCFCSDSTDPYFNLACEEYLLSQVRQDERYLFLWVSETSVVIGKNQNPWRECNLAYLKHHGIKLARRISGGGAVYHDSGNLNCSFITSRLNYHPEDNWEILDDVLADYNLKADRSTQHSVMVNGFKISGNAFCLQKNASMHHFTLLIDADRQAMHECLQGIIGDVQTHAVCSVPAHVVNLKELNDAINVSDVKNSMWQLFVEKWGGKKAKPRLISEGHTGVLGVADKYRSKEWIWGRTPSFTVHWMLGCIQVRITVNKGVIETCTSEAEGQGPVLDVQDLSGCAFHAQEICNRLSGNTSDYATALREYVGLSSW